MTDNLSATLDPSLGREEKLPSNVNIQEFFKDRVEEIVMLTEALKESPFRGQVFQRLPKHMRRRQMSHHIKRLPRRLRNTLAKEEPPTVPKRPSRKYRRRPSNLLSEYNRRQRNNIWLETHIWHAKRFHMTKKWGYVLADKCSSKSFRACYRATTKHCFLTDMSYYNCIELTGSENRLLEGLQQCVSSDCGLTFAAKMYINGSREGSVTLFHPNSYPFGVIGQVSFLWKPIEEKDKNRTIWIFTHTMYHNEIIDVFQSLFNLEEIKKTESVNGIEEKIKNLRTEKIPAGKNKEIMKLESRNVPFYETPKYANNDGSVVMHLLKDTINRFRLSGPLSLAVISSAFQCNALDVYTRKENESSAKAGKRSYPQSFGENAEPAKRIKSETDVVENIPQENNSVWWRRFYDNEFCKKCLESQETFYKELMKFSSPSDLPPKIVFSLVVRDPRLTIPTKRTKSTSDIQAAPPLCTAVDSTVCNSPLWRPEIRDVVSRKKLTTSQINEARSRLIVPGSDVCKFLEDNKQERIPLIVIQRPGIDATDSSSDNSDLGSGFDIIVPAGWAMPVWLSLVYRGARTGGLQESESLLLECKDLSQFVQPDSDRGEKEKWEKFNSLKDTYFKLPTNKRTNFAVTGFVSPFFPLWELLLAEWCVYEDDRAVESRKLRQQGNQTEANKLYSEVIALARAKVPKIYVLRDKKKLIELSDMFNKLFKHLKTGRDCEFRHSFREEDLDCLVPVSIESFDRGTPTDLALLCLPTAEDIFQFKKEKCSPVEEKFQDSKSYEKKQVRIDYGADLKAEKRRRKAQRRRMREGQEDSTSHPATNSSDIIAKKKKALEELWLCAPEKIEHFIDNCSRTVIGYIVHGGFSFSKARGAGLGYVTFRSLLYFLKMCYENKTDPLILFRNNNTFKYRFGNIKICI
ncbi:UNVERIFIED_CONTAM: hypothetical protein PYX00_007976 [Menopon gallinae]|uniref:Uncharacterized protein n=1 Tax=Menopon gallinae TaxID=328185 RepID=A0AAW2HLD1_9NEOP